MFEEKIKTNSVDKLKLSEIDEFIEDNWLLWACRFELSPCGHLTLYGKEEYIENNIDEIKELIEFNKNN